MMIVLAYYELLNKVVSYLNDVIESQNTTNENFTTLNGLFNVLKEFVDTYFDELNVQEEINRKIDGLVTDGTMDYIINQEVFGGIKSELAKTIKQTDTLSMNNMGQDVREALTGGSVAVVGSGAVIEENIADGQVSPKKTNFMNVENIPVTEKTGFFINASSGTLVSNVSYAYSENILLKQNETLTFEGGGYLEDVAMISEWSESGSFIKTHVPSIDGTKRTYRYTPTKDKEFIRLSWRTSFGYHAYKYPNVIEKSKKAENTLKTMNDLSLSLTTGKYINGSLAYVTHANPLYVHSEPLLLFKGESIKLLNAEKSGTVSIFTKCDRDGSLLESLVLAPNNNTQNFSYTAREDVEYIRVSYYASTAYLEFDRKIVSMANTFNKMLTPVNTSYEFTDKRDLKHLVKTAICIGDSITRGAYYHGSYTGQPIDENYPYYLGKMTDWTVVNAGHSGITTLGWYQDQSTNYDLVNQNIYIINLGTNGGLTDTLEADVNPYGKYNQYASTNTGAYCAIIEKIYEKNPKALIYMVDIDYAGGGDITTSKTVLTKIAEKYNIPFINRSILKDADVYHPY